MSRSALLLAVASTSIASAAMFVSLRHDAPVGPPTNPSSATDPELTTAVAALREELQQLKRAQLQPEVAPPPAAPLRQEADPASGVRLAALEQRLEQIESELKRLAERPAKAQPTPEQRAALAEAEARRNAELPELLTKFADLRLTEAERLRALSTLRGRTVPGTTRKATHDAADAAIQLVQTSTVAKTRADVWRQMHGAGNARLAPHLVQSLLHDADADVREEAAESLDEYLDQPGVRQALQLASQNDADEKVRRQAARSLAR
ncbi:MAG TPA: HEAT repeat domain-containing protein [Planctomycetota bacterium]